MKSVIMGHFFCSTLNFIKSSDLSFIYRQKSHIPQRGDLQPTEPPCVFSKLNKPAMMWIITPRLAEAFFFFNRLLSHCSSSQCCIVLLTLTPSALYFSPDGGGSCFQSDGSGIKECWTSICQLASYTEFRQILIEVDQGGGRVVGVGGGWPVVEGRCHGFADLLIQRRRGSVSHWLQSPALLLWSVCEVKWKHRTCCFTASNTAGATGDWTL